VRPYITNFNQENNQTFSILSNFESFALQSLKS
jgi:hypothetical protein